MNNPLLLSFYGDDLTGSTDALEALTLAGIETVLFVRPPTATERSRFPNARAIGLAGSSRSQSPSWMSTHLPPALQWLRSQDAAICHYKICSTFDSAPDVGSIGRAIELGAKAFAQQATPLVVGVPQLGRYTFFGQLFAAYQGHVHRIDRHPVMSRHPVTPATEADLRLHLGRQTNRSIGLIELPVLSHDQIDRLVDERMRANDIVLFDVADAASQQIVGRQLWRLKDFGSRFVVGSSGVEYALIQAWRALGEIQDRPWAEPLDAVDRLAVVSGSVSPTTERQIRYAHDHGFVSRQLDVSRLLADEDPAWAISLGMEALQSGQSVILATAMGDASRVEVSTAARNEIGRRLGIVLAGLVRQAGLRRAVVAGGDTSSHALQELGILSLMVRMPLPATPGSPLCRTYDQMGLPGPELAFKGGQIGGDEYFVRMRDGMIQERA